MIHATRVILEGHTQEGVWSGAGSASLGKAIGEDILKSWRLSQGLNHEEKLIMKSFR